VRRNPVCQGREPRSTGAGAHGASPPGGAARAGEQLSEAERQRILAALRSPE
jgi:hypothetical protein